MNQPDVELVGPCDACPAKAQVLTEHRHTGRPLTLQWCGHHFAHHAKALAASRALVLTDHRIQLVTSRT